MKRFCGSLHHHFEQISVHILSAQNPLSQPQTTPKVFPGLNDDLLDRDGGQAVEMRTQVYLPALAPQQRQCRKEIRETPTEKIFANSPFSYKSVKFMRRFLATEGHNVSDIQNMRTIVRELQTEPIISRNIEFKNPGGSPQKQ